MPNLALSDAGIRGFQAPDSGTTTFWDTTQRGLGVRVSPKGTKTFIVLMGSGSRHKLGRYPLITLATARTEARKLLAKKTLDTYEKPSTLLWETAVEKYLAACGEKNRPKTVYEYRLQLTPLPFKGRRLTSIKKRDVADVLEKITARSMRAHVLTSIKAFFSWCASEGHIEASPVTALKPPAQKKTKKRVLTPDELREVFGKALKHPYPFGAIVALLVLNGQRRNETVSYEWERISATTITIPAEVSKNGNEHTFPYGELTRQVLHNLPKTQSPYVFPSRNRNGTIWNGWSKAKLAFDATLENVAPYTLHDLRRTFVTTLQSLGVPFEVREKLVNHVQQGVSGVYSQYSYEKEMREAIRTYEAFLLNLLGRGE